MSSLTDAENEALQWQTHTYRLQRNPFLELTEFEKPNNKIIVNTNNIMGVEYTYRGQDEYCVRVYLSANLFFDIEESYEEIKRLLG